MWLKGEGMALETMLLFLFCSACLEERTLRLGLDWQGRKETFLLPFADPQYPLLFFVWSVCLSLDMFPVSVQEPSLLVTGTPILFLPPRSTGVYLSPPQCPCSYSPSGFWPIYPSLCLSPQDPWRKNQATFPRTELEDIVPATPDPAL